MKINVSIGQKVEVNYYDRPCVATVVKVTPSGCIDIRYENGAVQRLSPNGKGRADYADGVALVGIIK